ncbi:hypothetical protein Tco_1113890 [Tanacetum coccineum]|uniref:Uncharacterized protein n=1 Tax=Tanacetum coccineum TaxID=301880 RepID=A0ABQ5ITG7_9ASTR
MKSRLQSTEGFEERKRNVNDKVAIARTSSAYKSNSQKIGNPSNQTSQTQALDSDNMNQPDHKVLQQDVPTHEGEDQEVNPSQTRANDKADIRPQALLLTVLIQDQAKMDGDTSSVESIHHPMLTL